MYVELVIPLVYLENFLVGKMMFVFLFSFNDNGLFGPTFKNKKL